MLSTILGYEMTQLSLKHSTAMIDAAFDEGTQLGLKPLSVAVVDAGGHLIAFARQDGASTLRPQIASAKACGALGLGVSSRKISDMAAERSTFVVSLVALSKQGMIPAPGGVIIVNESGNTIGAIGVTGDTSDNDELCAFAAIAGAGLIAQA